MVSFKTHTNNNGSNYVTQTKITDIALLSREIKGQERKNKGREKVRDDSYIISYH
jgi:hypothetical protein